MHVPPIFRRPSGHSHEWLFAPTGKHIKPHLLLESLPKQSFVPAKETKNNYNIREKKKRFKYVRIF